MGYFNADAQSGTKSKSAPKETTVQKRPLKSSGLLISNDHATSCQAPGTMITGVVLDKESGLPVPFASVKIKGTPAVVSADSAGAYAISLPAGYEAVLTMTSVGYQATEDSLPNGSALHVSYMEKTSMENVVIPGYGSKCLEGRVGGYIAAVRVTKTQRIKREVKSWLPDNSITVSPNPVLSGQELVVKLAIKKAGTYTMRLMSSNGAILNSTAVKLDGNPQTINIPASPAWGRGVLWLYISARDGKDAHQAKVIIQ